MTTSFKTKDEEIQYLSSMISATRKEDTERLKTIGLRLIELAVIHNNSIEPLTSRITEFDNISVHPILRYKNGKRFNTNINK